MASSSESWEAETESLERQDGMSLIGLIVFLILALLVAGAFLAVVRAILATPPFAEFQPYAGVIYALVVLLVVLVIVGMIYNGGVPAVFDFGRTRIR